MAKITEYVDLCPNGQDQTECTEIDPCEMCWGDLEIEAEEIEDSIAGLVQ